MTLDRDLKITAAAVKIGDQIIEGRRHSEIISRCVAEGLAKRVTQDQQGFVTQDGRFWNRFQAGAIAFRAGQTATRRETLLSEDLW